MSTTINSDLMEYSTNATGVLGSAIRIQSIIAIIGPIGMAAAL